MSAFHGCRGRYELRRFIARLLSRGRLHRIQLARVAGVDIVLKSRRRGSGFAIAVGNQYLRLQRSFVEILPDQEWLQWESAVETARIPRSVAPAPEVPDVNFRGLVSPACPGISLQNLLSRPDGSVDGKFAAIRWSLNSLHQLHQHRIDWGKGIQQSISHGDATVNNVMVDEQAASATWIDFDIRHHPQLPESVRRADDFRALIFSVAAHVPRCCYPRLAAEFFASLPDPSSLGRVRQCLANEWRCPNTFQLAQAPLSWTAHTALLQSLLDRVGGLSSSRSHPV